MPHPFESSRTRDKGSQVILSTHCWLILLTASSQCQLTLQNPRFDPAVSQFLLFFKLRRDWLGSGPGICACHPSFLYAVLNVIDADLFGLEVLLVPHRYDGVLIHVVVGILLFDEVFE
jgi:hypothetical protein